MKAITRKTQNVMDYSEIIENVHHEIILQVEGGETLCSLISDNDQTLGLSVLFETVLSKIKYEVNKLEDAHRVLI
jgi:hypothetical protein